MDESISRAGKLISAFKDDRYAFGPGALERVGPLAAQLGRRALVVTRLGSAWLQPTIAQCRASLDAAGVTVLATVQGAEPNSPREDVYRLQGHILHRKPDVVVSIESGSGIDACKAAAVLATLGDVTAEIEPYFGAGQVTNACRQTGRSILPVLAVMTAASSASHLTRYANVTDPVAGQKKIVIDDAIVPPRAVFDYSVTASQPRGLTLDGGLDGISHCLEVYYGFKGSDVGPVEEVSLTGVELILSGLKSFAAGASDPAVREQLGLGTDLGGYAIMLGGTSGPHLNSYSLVKYLAHGRACALMMPYYTVFFAPAVEARVRKVGALYRKLGYLDESAEGLSGRALGLAVARGMMAFNRSIGFPTALRDVPGIERSVLDKTLASAKNPQLKSRLQNMPVPLTADLVDRYMGSVLEAAWSGDPDRIENL